MYRVPCVAVIRTARTVHIHYTSTPVRCPLLEVILACTLFRGHELQSPEKKQRQDENKGGKKHAHTHAGRIGKKVFTPKERFHFTQGFTAKRFTAKGFARKVFNPKAFSLQLWRNSGHNIKRNARLYYSCMWCLSVCLSPITPKAAEKQPTPPTRTFRWRG